MKHGFVVGQTYPSRRGDFEVVSIDGIQMRIRFAADELESEVPVRDQWRIVENIGEESEVEVEPPVRKKGATVRVATVSSLGGKFQGLEANDFKKSVRGTSWRRRDTLAGLLLKRLHDLSSRQVFTSIPVERRPTVHLVLPQKQREQDGRLDAKFAFFLALDGKSSQPEQESDSPYDAFYGFYVEKTDGVLDETWDWVRFLPALAQPDIQAAVRRAMEKHGLYWQMEVWNQEHDEIAQDVKLKLDGTRIAPTSTSEVVGFTWQGLIDRLQNLPGDQWCDLFLVAYLPKDEAIAAKTTIAAKAASVYHDLMPLYLASVR